MANPTAEVGSFALPAAQYNISITAATTIILPTGAQRRPTLISPANIKALAGGVLSMMLSLEAQNARYTVDGTVPTATNGILIVAPCLIIFRGEHTITSLKIISVAAGGVINYGFTMDTP